MLKDKNIFYKKYITDVLTEKRYMNYIKVASQMWEAENTNFCFKVASQIYFLLIKKITGEILLDIFVGTFFLAWQIGSEITDNWSLKLWNINLCYNYII